jgi:hypothetical protein
VILANSFRGMAEWSHEFLIHLWKVKVMCFKKILLGFLVIVLMLPSITGCKDSKLNAIELVPHNADLIAKIQLSKIINDRDFRDAYDSSQKDLGQPRTAEEGLDELVRDMGVDLRNFSQCIIFTDITRLNTGYGAAIVEGTFDEEQFISNIEQKAGEKFSSSDYKDYKLYTDEEADFGIAFLNDSIFIIGTTEAIKDAIDVNEGVREPINGVVLKTYNQLGDVLIKCALKFPEEAIQAITEESMAEDFPMPLTPFSDIDIVGFSFNKKASTIPIQITFHYLRSDSAENAKETFSGAISLFKGMSQDPELEDMLDKLEVSVTDSSLTLSFEVALNEIGKLMNTF